MSRLVAQKVARLKTIVAERADWAQPLVQSKRMRQWVLDADHILDGSWAQAGEVVSKATVGQRLDAWRTSLSEHLTDGTLSDLEQECLTQFLQELSNLRPYLVQCSDRESFPRTVPREGTQHRRPQDSLSPHERAQELEYLSAALWALRGV